MARRIRHGRGSSLLELQVALMLLAMSLLALGSGLATTSRLLGKLEERQRAVLTFSDDGSRAVLSSIRTVGEAEKEEKAKTTLELLTLVQDRGSEEITVIAQRAPES